ncbi:MAG: iron-containing alcohol dehydrogenase [Bacilli bacterium]|nr:iron-containing alcohol dehydrogenase [Bacilli bacterium]
MKNFEYQALTKIIFGKNEIERLKSELVENNVKNLLLVYGKGSIIKLGIYQKVVEVCEELSINLYFEKDVRPNPEVSSVRSGIQTCREQHIDFILAAGGGSVVDCAKAIGFGTYYDGDVWDIYLKKGNASKSIPIGVIITLAATGTETNGNSILSNDETHEKRSAAYRFSIPKFAIIDPSYTLSVSHHHVIAGSIDIMMHVFEQYFSNTLRTETSDYMSIGVLRSVIENTERILAGNDDYETRANISWASTVGLSFLLGADKVGDWATHRLSYAITIEYGTTHGYALALIFTSWLRVVLKYNPKTVLPKLKLLGELLQCGSEDVPDAIDELFNRWGAKTDMKEGFSDLTEESLRSLIQNALALGNVGTVIEVNPDIAFEIFKNSLGW